MPCLSPMLDFQSPECVIRLIDFERGFYSRCNCSGFVLGGIDSIACCSGTESFAHGRGITGDAVVGDEADPFLCRLGKGAACLPFRASRPQLFVTWCKSCLASFKSSSTHRLDGPVIIPRPSLVIMFSRISVLLSFIIASASLVSAQFNIFDQFFGGHHQQHQQHQQQQGRGVDWYKQHYDTGTLSIPVLCS